MTSHNTCRTNLWTCKSNGLKRVAAYKDCGRYDCNNSNFGDRKTAETTTGLSLNEEDDFNMENMFEQIFGEF